MGAPEPLLLVGAGGFAREAAAAVAAANAAGAAWDLLGFLDDDPARHGARVGSARVLGPIDAVHDHPDARIVLCTGRPGDYASRRRIAERLALPEDRYATIVHPTATVGTGSSVGSGSVLLAHVDLTADVSVGRHVAVMPQVVLTHDVRVGDFATVASGTRASGRCRIGAGAYLGTGCCLREGVEVGPQAMVGMGSVVTRDVPAGRLWFGAPARDFSAAPWPAARA